MKLTTQLSDENPGVLVVSVVSRLVQTPKRLVASISPEIHAPQKALPRMASEFGDPQTILKKFWMLRLKLQREPKLHYSKTLVITGCGLASIRSRQVVRAGSQGIFCESLFLCPMIRN